MLRIPEFALLADRLFLSFVFLLAGATKLADPVGFRKSWRDFGLPKALAPLAVLALPVAELAVAVALIPAMLAWYGAWGALALLSAFLAAVAMAMVRGRKPDCRCFGQLHSAPVGRSTLIRDGILAVCAGWLISRDRLDAGPDLWTWFGTLNGDEKKLAVLAACAAGVVFFRLVGRAQPASEPLALEQTLEEETVPEEPVARPRRVTRVERPRPRPEPEPAGPTAQGIGLPVGTPAPEFQLPSLAGETRTLQSVRQNGRDLLLVFSNPHCEPCNALVPKLTEWAREMEGWLTLAVITRGPMRDNLAKLKGLEPGRVLLQREFEISETYDVISTPTAVLIGADGLIRSPLATGREAIQKLISSHATGLEERLSGPEPGKGTSP